LFRSLTLITIIIVAFTIISMGVALDDLLAYELLKVLKVR